MSNMYVRDGQGNPKEISKIFVRDALGQPNEICKIFVRDANGIPQLVYECGAVVFPCPQCETQQYPLYYTSGTLPNSQQPRFGLNNTSTEVTNSILPSFNINKQYWSKVALGSTLSNEYQIVIADGDPYFSKKEFILPLDCEFCQNVDAPPLSWLNSNLYWNKLKDAYDLVNNYPLIPGHIIADWNSYTVADTIYILSKLLKRKFNTFCTHPESRNGQAQNPYCPYEWETPDITKYPFYDRPIWFKFETQPDYIPDGLLPNSSLSYCGQEICSDSLFGTTSTTIIECGDTFTTEGFIRPGSIRPIECECPPDTSEECETSGTTGTTRPECPCKCCINPGPNNPDPECRYNTSLCPFGCPGQRPPCPEGIDETTMCQSTWCYPTGCETFFSTTQTGPSENPFTFIMAVENHRTEYTVNGIIPGASIPADCCTSTCYGPVDMSAFMWGKGCRHVSQIPPINSIRQENANNPVLPFEDNLSFFRDFVISSLMNSTLPSGQKSYSVADVRVVLPYYVVLDDNLKGKLVSFKDTNQYNSFVNNGLGPGPVTSGSFYNQHLSVWNAIRSIFGISPGQIIQNVPENEKIWLSANHFAYEEMANRKNFFGQDQDYDEGLPYGLVDGSYRVQPGNSAINWSIKGYPTEKSTHYVVLELRYSQPKDRCLDSIFDEVAFTDLANQVFFISKIKFYPLDRVCKFKNNKFHKHPIFQTYIIPEIIQKYVSVSGYFGFVDQYNGSSWVQSNPNSSGALNTFKIPNFWSFTNGSTTLKYDLIYPPAASYGITYEGFLQKHYRRTT